MKTTLLFIFIIFTGGLSAQIPVLNSTMIPNIGDDYTYQLDTIPEHLLYVVAGSGGENVTWDFSNSISASGDTIVTSYVSPSTVNLGNAFPLCNIATVTSDGTPNFYELNNTGANNYGSVIGGYVFYFTNPLKLLFLPMTYLDNNTDSFAANYPQFPNYLERTGSITAISDGYGTLIMPGNNTYENVLRIKYTLNILDNYGGQNIDTLVEEYYDWYGSDITFPILQIGSRITNPYNSTENSIVKYIRIKTAQNLTTSSSNSNVSKISIYPNPSQGNCSINLPNVSSQNYQIIVCDAKGQRVFQENTVAQNSHVLPLEHLSQGVYFIQVANSNSIQTLKFIKQ